MERGHLVRISGRRHLACYIKEIEWALVQFLDFFQVILQLI